jgi:long-chain fatty acid transport protein
MVMSFVRRIAVFVCLASLAVTQALSSGFQLNEHGARAMGMGGAFSAKANDLSALYFNPAGLAYQKGFGVYLGGTAIMPKSTYTNPAGTSTDMVSQTFLLPNAYLGYELGNGLAIGLGVFAPFGLGTEWPAGWEGRRLALKTDVQAIVINPTVAYRINECFMVGAGFSWMTSKVEMSRNVATYSVIAVPPTPAPTDGLFAMEGTGNTFSFNAGAIYKPMPALSIGLSYRHTASVDFEGDATFTNMQALQPYFPGGAGTATIKFPNQIFAGISYDVNENLTLEFDYQWVGWSTYDSLIVNLPTGPVAPFPPQLGGPRSLQTTQKAEKAWTNSYVLRLGGEYRMNEWSFRAGFIYDATPQPNKFVEPILPDANRYEGTIGLGYKFAGNWSVDVAYQYISFAERTVTGPTTGDLNAFPGTYKNSANLFALSLGYSL